MPTTVLLVEDDSGYRAALGKLLQSCFPGLRVVEAEDGTQALNLTRLVQCDLVILDYYLHAVGGSDVARYLRQRAASGARMPLLVLTSSQPDVEIFTRAVGAAAFLHKPCTAEQMIAVLGPLLERAGYLGPDQTT
jgi:DNA-binding response OmpR family regulator